MVAHIRKLIFIASLYCLWIVFVGVKTGRGGIIEAILSLGICYAAAHYLLKFNWSNAIFNLKLIPYCLWLLKEIYKSGWTVVKIIWNPSLPIAPCFEWIEFDGASSAAFVLYGNSITLTPGTITLDIKDGLLLVHALDGASIEDLKTGYMADKVKAVESKPDNAVAL